jgi:hypothetical protein
MKHWNLRYLILGSSLTLVSAFAFAQNTEVTYMEGNPKLRNNSGALSALDYGSQLRTGESVITGKADLAELSQGDLATIRVRPNTVFTIREVEQGGQKEQVLTTTVGAVAMRFNRLAGKEPRIGTISTVAGIRGTEVTVFAGPDGSALFLVDSGQVDVSSAGKTVSLTEKEAVEVPAGGPPGEKYSVIGRTQSFPQWASEKNDAFLADPVGSLDKISSMMAQFKQSLDEWVAKFNTAKSDSDAAAEKMKSINDQEQQKKYRDTVWIPLSVQTINAGLNYRYYTVSALSLRRFIMGPMYMQMRTRNILKADDQYRVFMDKYNKVLADFRSVFEPYTNIADY